VAVMLLLYSRGLPEMLSGAVFLLSVAVSTVIFIASGMEEEHFRKQYPVITDFYTEKQKKEFHRRYIWYIAGGVGAILFGLVLMCLANYAMPETEASESLMGSAFLLIVAAACYFLVCGGMLEDKYDIPKYNLQNTPEYKERCRRAATACAVIMLLATAVFLFMGLAYEKWDWAAVIYPVGGVLCGAAWLLLGPRDLA